MPDQQQKYGGLLEFVKTIVYAIVIAGLSGALLVSSDGRHFQMHREADRRGYSGVAAAGDGVVLVGEGGVRTLPRASLMAAH